MTEHRWSGWPGAWCLDCGCDDPGEIALVDGFDPCTNTWSPPEAEAAWHERYAEVLAGCKEPNSLRHDPYQFRLSIGDIGGMCPVQAEGTINEKPFYFRARGEDWALSIGGDDVIAKPEWYRRRRYGDFPSAGYITHAEAVNFIRDAGAAYVRGEPGDGDEVL